MRSIAADPPFRYGPVLAFGIATLAALPAAGHLPPEVLRANIGGWLATTLEDRFQRTAIGDPASLTGVVVLGGGEERLREAARLARHWPHLKVFVSSAGDPHYVRRIIGTDIEESRITIETTSRNTFEN